MASPTSPLFPGRLRERSRSVLASSIAAWLGLAASAGAVSFSSFPVATPGSAPSGIVTAADGNLWSAEFASDRIVRMTPGGTVTEFPLAAGRGPLGITAGPDGNVWFTERLGDRIGRLNPAAGSSSAILASLAEFAVPGAGSAPTGIVAGPDGALWFTEFGSDQIGRITTAGAVTEFVVPGDGSAPSGIARGPDGNLWFTESGSDQIGRISPAGVVLNEFAVPGVASDPEDIVAGPDGAMWFTEFGTDQIGRANTAGVTNEFSLPRGSGPLSIAASPLRGRLSFTEPAANRVGLITRFGALWQLGVGTTPSGSTIGPDGQLWLADQGADALGRLAFVLGAFAVGADAGGGPQVEVFSVSHSSQIVPSFFAYGAGFTGGVRVAVGDVNGDLNPDVVTGPGAGGGPNVRVFSGTTGQQFGPPLGSFLPYDPGFTGGVFVAVGDVDGDGLADVITGAGPGGGPNVRVFSGATGQPLGGPLGSFFAFDPGFTGGVRVAAADVDGDGKDDVICGAGPGGGPNVRVFSGASGQPLGGPLGSFFAYDPGFTGGVFVAGGDVNGDGKADVITGPGAGGGPNVKVFSGATGQPLPGAVGSFFAYDPGFTGGVRVAATNVNHDGKADLVTGAGPGGGPDARVFRGSDLAVLDDFFAFDPGFTGGIHVGGAN